MWQDAAISEVWADPSEEYRKVFGVEFSQHLELVRSKMYGMMKRYLDPNEIGWILIGLKKAIGASETELTFSVADVNGIDMRHFGLWIYSSQTLVYDYLFCHDQEDYCTIFLPVTSKLFPEINVSSAWSSERKNTKVTISRGR